MPEIRVPNGEKAKTLSVLSAKGCKVSSVKSNFSHTYIEYSGRGPAPVSRPIQEANFRRSFGNSHIPHEFGEE